MSNCRFGVSPVNYPDPDPIEATSENRYKGQSFEKEYGIQYSNIHAHVTA